MRRTNLLVILLLILLCNYAQAQPQWHWGLRGGSSGNTINPTPGESVVDMATDAHGNVYFIAMVKADAAATISGYNGPVSNYGADDILLASYDCAGNYRWHKSIGGYTTDMALLRGGLGLDSLGGVYIASTVISPGIIGNQPAVHFGSDTILAKGTRKSLFLVKYDTSGIFQWLRMPEPDTIGIFSANSAFRTLHVDKGGDVYLHINSYGGAMADGNMVLPGPGDYILKYNAAGSLLNYITLGMQTSRTTQFDAKLSRDRNSGNFYIAGSYSSYSGGAFAMGGNSITNSAIVGAFNAQGQYLWHRTNNYQHIQGFHGYPQVDHQGNITLTGTFKGGGSLNDGFNGYTMSNPLSNVTRDCPFIVKLSPSGQNIWAINARSTTSNSILAITQTGSEVIIGGGASGLITWPGGADSINLPGLPHKPFIARFDAATGVPVSMSYLNADNSSQYNVVTSLTSYNGNIYAGGTFGYQLDVAGQNWTSSGGNNDFFVARFGYDCNCTPPAAGFTKTITGKTASFTYTGTAAFLSVRWDFGDGSLPVTAVNPGHTYASAGTYNVCVTVTSDCGNHTYCEQVQVSDGIGITGAEDLAPVRIYPNPAYKELHISDAVPGTILDVYSIAGQHMTSHFIKRANEVLDISRWPAGVYFARFKAKTGASVYRKFLKQ
ncbi:MAG: T9SS type A sorting domain-containing protein [Sphingobacteriales bacterium]|nr:MAG: T9SS type A sorting domain-containing protein [Sphingobacteriales bacterium]